MAKRATAAFIRALSDELARHPVFLENVVARVAWMFVGHTELGTPGKPRHPERQLDRNDDTIARVFQAIHDGASTRSAIVAASGVAPGEYAFAIRLPRDRGVLRVEGTGEQAKLRIG